MMPAPLLVQDRGMGAFEPVSAAKRLTNVHVFYATNRVPEAAGESGARYSSANGWDVRLGTADVRLGAADWDWTRLTRETLDGSRPAIHVTRVEEYGLLSSNTQALAGASTLAGSHGREAEDRFASEINRTLAGCSRKDVTVYVPGFNLTFEEGLLRTTEFSYFLGHEGVFVSYAWPAHTHPFLYNLDRRHAIESIEGFVAFVRFLEERTDADRIHFITNSAGAPLMTGLLKTLRAEHAGLSPDELRRRTRLGQVVYAASDQDVEGFCAMLDAGTDEVCEHITVYSSSVDLGLILTWHFGSGDWTIGRLPANMTDTQADLLVRHARRVTVVDATEAIDQAGRGDLWAHKYWYRNPWVSSDLLQVIHDGAPPASRGLVPVRDGALWAFPPDYPDRLRAADHSQSANQ
jgi:esterase/lipase superfamily enzyme